MSKKTFGVLVALPIVVALGAQASCGTDESGPAPVAPGSDAATSDATTSPDAASPDGAADASGPRRLVDRSDLLPAFERSTTDVALVDVDGDKDLDIVWIAQSWPPVGEVQFPGGLDITLNKGPEKLERAPSGALPSIGDWTFVLAVDIDGDKDQDLVLTRPARTSREVTLLLNDGTGKFTEKTLPSVTGVADGVVFGRATAGDLDGDGDLDLLVPTVWTVEASGTPTTQDLPNVILINQGNGNFVKDTAGQRLPALPSGQDWTLTAAAGELTGDSRVDILLGEGEAVPRLLVRGDAGAFLDDSAGRFPPDLKLRPYRTELVDLDRDGDLDIVVVSDTPSANPPDAGPDGAAPWAQGNHVLLNDGKGKFSHVPLPAVGRRDGRGLAFGDINRDGRLDILISNGNLTVPHGGEALEVLLSKGGGGFERMTGVPTLSAGVFAVAAGDLDGDGADDIVLAVSEPDSASSLKSRVFLNR